MGGIPLLAYIPINIDPVIFYIGPLALRWYGLMYVVGIVLGLWFIRGYTKRKGISQATVYRILWWCIVAGLIGGRLYFVIQQPNFFSFYIKQPQHILAIYQAATTHSGNVGRRYGLLWGYLPGHPHHFLAGKGGTHQSTGRY